MRLFKFLTVIILTLFICSCGSNSTQGKKSFSITTNAVKNKNSKVFSIQKSSLLHLKINNPNKNKIDSTTYSLNGMPVKESVDLINSKLGVQKIVATVYYDGQSQSIDYSVVILNDKAPKIYTFKIINEYPHDITSYTQGLEFYNGELYESTGQRGKSKLRKVDYKTGAILKNIDLSKNYFGEGLTILNNNIYQLTWQSGTGFVYDVNTFEKKSSFKYGKSKEGWGLCNNTKVIYKSDGTEKIWTLDPETLVEKGFIQAFTNKGKINNLNELEWIEGKIYANRYQKNGVAIINPNNGAIDAVIDFSPLIKNITQQQNWDSKNNVLNGIAYNPDTKTIFVTGKNWDKLFEVEILKN